MYYPSQLNHFPSSSSIQAPIANRIKCMKCNNMNKRRLIERFPAIISSKKGVAQEESPLKLKKYKTPMENACHIPSSLFRNAVPNHRTINVTPAQDFFHISTPGKFRTCSAKGTEDRLIVLLVIIVLHLNITLIRIQMALMSVNDFSHCFVIDDTAVSTSHRLFER
uniref:Uncharacterized protein n=1 Tax=Glossina palpalis gambiensis TaxID=67801 RepID=A0A1B0C3S3_9MUSC